MKSRVLLSIGLWLGLSTAFAIAVDSCTHASETCAALGSEVSPCVPSSDGQSITCPRERLDAIVQCVYAERARASAAEAKLAELRPDAGQMLPPADLRR
jgi:hypothetical protein